MPQDALPCRGVAICIYKSANGGVVISALQVVEAGLGVVVVAAVAEGVGVCQGAGGGEDFAVGVVGVGGCGAAFFVYEAQHIALEVGDVVVHRVVNLQRKGIATLVVEEVEGGVAVGLPEELAACVEVGVGNAVHRLGHAQPVGIVGVGNTLCAVGGGDQLSAVSPAQCPAGAVVITDGVTAVGCAGDGAGFRIVGLTLVGNRLPAVSRQRTVPCLLKTENRPPSCPSTRRTVPCVTGEPSPRPP